MRSLHRKFSPHFSFKNLELFTEVITVSIKMLRYGKLIDLVDQMFPPLTSSKTTDPSRSEYTLFCYWRTPVMAVPEEDVEEFEFP